MACVPVGTQAKNVSRLFSFPRSAWERTCATLRVASFATRMAAPVGFSRWLAPAAADRFGQTRNALLDPLKVQLSLNDEALNRLVKFFPMFAVT